MQLKIDVLVGKTFSEVINIDDEKLIFKNDDVVYMFYHEQDCCEDVTIEDICGDLNDLVGEPILLAEESSDYPEIPNARDSETWTFYKFATRKGYVDVRWYGSSNGYYSERVDFVEADRDHNAIF